MTWAIIRNGKEIAYFPCPMLAFRYAKAYGLQGFSVEKINEPIK
jgi:hypothetical protein